MKMHIYCKNTVLLVFLMVYAPAQAGWFSWFSSSHTAVIPETHLPAQAFSDLPPPKTAFEDAVMSLLHDHSQRLEVLEEQNKTIWSHVKQIAFEIPEWYSRVIAPYVVRTQKVAAESSAYIAHHKIPTTLCGVTLMISWVSYTMSSTRDALYDAQRWSLWQPPVTTYAACSADQKIADLLRAIYLRYGNYQHDLMVPFQKFFQELSNERKLLLAYQRYAQWLLLFHVERFIDKKLYKSIEKRLRQLEELNLLCTTWILAKKMNSPYAQQSAAENTYYACAY